ARAGAARSTAAGGDTRFPAGNGFPARVGHRGWPGDEQLSRPLHAQDGTAHRSRRILRAGRRRDRGDRGPAERGRPGIRGLGDADDVAAAVPPRAGARSAQRAEARAGLNGRRHAGGATASDRGSVAMTFWTDAAVLGAAGIPSVLFGPAGAGLHSAEEYVEI